MSQMRVVPVSPIGTRASTALVNHGGHCRLENIDVTVYPASRHAMAVVMKRRSLGLSLREAAARIGLAPRDLSDIEHGRAVFEHDGDLNLALLRMEDR